MIATTHEALAANLSHAGCERRIRAAQLMTLKTADFARRDTHPPADIEAFAVLGAAFLPQLDEATAMRVAEAIVPRPDCPAAIVAALVRRGDGAGRIALRGAPRIDRESLAIALLGGAGEARCLAGRHDLDREAVDVLLARDDRETTLALAANIRAPLDETGAHVLVARARADQALARALLARGEQLGHRWPALFVAAPSRTRREMIGAVARLARLDGRTDRWTPPSAAALPPIPAPAGHLALWLESVLSVPGAVVAGIMGDSSGEALAVTLRALGVAPVLAERCLIFHGTRDGASADAALRAARFFRSLDARVASRLLALITGVGDQHAADAEKPTAPAAPRDPRALPARVEQRPLRRGDFSTRISQAS